MFLHERDSLYLLRKYAVKKEKETVAWIQGSSWETEKQPEATCLFAAFATLLHMCARVCVRVFSVCAYMCGFPVCTFFFFPTVRVRVCLCVQMCALISFYWHCCVTCWILMWDDLFLPLSSRCSQRYPTRFKTPPVTSWEISRKARLITSQLFTKVIYLAYLFHI